MLNKKVPEMFTYGLWAEGDGAGDGLWTATSGRSLWTSGGNGDTMSV